MSLIWALLCDPKQPPCSLVLLKILTSEIYQLSNYTIHLHARGFGVLGFWGFGGTSSMCPRGTLGEGGGPPAAGGLCPPATAPLLAVVQRDLAIVDTPRWIMVDHDGS